MKQTCTNNITRIVCLDDHFPKQIDGYGYFPVISFEEMKMSSEKSKEL